MAGAKIDDTQRRLVPFLRAQGASFLSLATLGRGAPDGLVGYHGRDCLVEFKTGKAPLMSEQVQWHILWRGHRVQVIRDEAGALSLLETLRLAR